jgi:hypothetical protein
LSLDITAAKPMQSRIPAANFPLFYMVPVLTVSVKAMLAESESN